MGLSGTGCALATRTPSLANLIPPFPLYARVLNPARRSDSAFSRWRALAGPTLDVDGRTQWYDVVESNPEAADWNVEMGTVDSQAAPRLSTILARHTATPDHCFFLAWEGYSGSEV